MLYNKDYNITFSKPDFKNLLTDKNYDINEDFIKLNEHIIKELINLGVLKSDINSCRDTNIGLSDYSKHIIQPWSIWLDYNLNPWDADIIKRILRTKKEYGMSEVNSRILDYKKIIHICNERIRQLEII